MNINRAVNSGDIVILDFTKVKVQDLGIVKAKVLKTAPNPFTKNSYFIDFLDLELEVESVCDSVYIKEIISTPSAEHGTEGNQRISHEC